MQSSLLRRLVFWVPVFATIGIVLFMLFRPVPVPVDLAVVERGRLRVTVGDEGMTRVRDVFVLSAPLAGRQQRIEYDAGDRVEADDTVVIRIEPSDPGFLDVRTVAQAQAAARTAEAALALARAEMRRAETDLEYARTELDRARRLSRSSISESALDEARQRFQTAGLLVEQAQARVQVREYELERVRAELLPSSVASRQRDRCDCLEIRSPVSGTILRILRKSEGVVSAGEPLVEIGDPSDLEIVVDLLSSDAVRVESGQRVVIDAWGGDRLLEGSVRRVEPVGFTRVSALGIEEQRVNVIIDIIDPREYWQRLGHGFRVKADIILWESAGVVRIPISTMFREAGEWTVFVVEEGVARRRTIEVGRRNDLHAQITAGLEVGETIVLYPGDRVDEGTPVIPR